MTPQVTAAISSTTVDMISPVRFFFMGYLLFFCLSCSHIIVENLKLLKKIRLFKKKLIFLGLLSIIKELLDLCMDMDRLHRGYYTGSVRIIYL